jgi:hypothetical protein
MPAAMREIIDDLAPDLYDHGALVEAISLQYVVHSD